MDSAATLDEDPDNLAAAIATITDTGARRQAAARAAQDRRSQLATYVEVYAEAYGTRLPLSRLEAGDELLTALTTLADA